MRSSMIGLLVYSLLQVVTPGVTEVGQQVRVISPLAVPDGGPQGLEGYVTVAHDRGNTRLAIGTIGNIEMNARGSTIEARSLQGGGVVTNDGHVERWSSLYLSQPKAGEGYTGPVNVERVDYITFDNGWSIRPQGDNLLICHGKVCRSLE